MQSIGCTLINKDHGISCDLSLSYKIGEQTGQWDRLKTSLRPPGKYSNNMNFGDTGQMAQAQGDIDGKHIPAFITLFDPGAWPKGEATSRTPPIVYIFCGSWDTVIERVTCGGFVSGKAILFRSTRMDIEFELWYGCA